MLRLHKIEAARRQIESAIWLWFVDADMISVRTLTGAAHRLILDLAELWGVTAFPFTAGYFPARTGKDKKSATPNAETYFKNAKQGEMYELSEAWTELYLFDAVMAYTNLVDNRSGSALMSMFVLRFGVQRQDLFVRGTFSLLEKRVSQDFNIERLEQLTKIEFLKEFFGILGQPTG
jgi:hypothetical protein